MSQLLAKVQTLLGRT